MEEFLKSGLPFWIVGGVIAIVMAVLTKRSKNKLAPQKHQELERKVTEDFKTRKYRRLKRLSK